MRYSGHRVRDCSAMPYRPGSASRNVRRAPPEASGPPAVDQQGLGKQLSGMFPVMLLASLSVTEEPCSL
jgi:hypothetical protein